MNTPFSVHLVVALEWIFGSLVGFCCLMFLVDGFYGIIHFNLTRILTSFGIAILVGAIAWASFATGSGLRDGRGWAWRASWGIGIFAMFFGAWTIYDLFHAKVHGPDDGYALIFWLFLMICVLFGMVLLLLPPTREYLRSTSNGSGEASF
jgi:hypothetical protein